MRGHNLRLELNSESFYLLSYHYLEYAKFDSEKDRDTLMLSFLGHQVRIVGRNLRELAVALQKRAVESVMQNAWSLQCRKQPVQFR